jgi:hypothetical protein
MGAIMGMKNVNVDVGLPHRAGQTWKYIYTKRDKRAHTMDVTKLERLGRMKHGLQIDSGVD